MNKDPILFERREELGRKIAAGEYKSLLDVISDEIGRAIQRLTKSTRPLPFWCNVTAITLVLLAVDLLVSLLLGEFSATRYESIWIELSAPGIIIVGLSALKAYLDRAYKTLREDILDKMRSVEDLADLERWLSSMAKVKQPLAFSVAWAFLAGLPLHLAGAAVTGVFNFGPVILFTGVNMGGAISLWYIVLFLSLASRLSRYQFDLYAANPSASEVIRHLSNLFNGLVFLQAGVMALFTLLWTFSPEFISSDLIILSVFIAWGPVIALFVFSQSALSKIITRAKQGKLDEIKRHIEQLESREEIPSLDSLAHINALMDYHDRINGTRSLALDFKTGLNLLNSLLLPLLAFILSNLSKLFDLFF